MTEASKTWLPPISADTSKPTSSQVSGGGLPPFGSQIGPTTCLSGPAAAPVSLSVRQGAATPSLTSGISGRLGSRLFNSADLQSSLESKLRVLTRSSGSTLYTLTWKEQATPSGRLYCLLRASGRRTSGIEFTGWLTPTARDWKGYTKREGESICNQLRRLYGGTGKPNPRWLAWLMGYETEAWVRYAPSGTRSSRR